VNSTNSTIHYIKTQNLNNHNKPENAVKNLKILYKYNNDWWKGKKPVIIRADSDVSVEGQVKMTLLPVREIIS